MSCICLLMALFVLLALTLGTVSADNWSGKKWKQQGRQPLALELVADVDGAWTTTVQAATDAWSLSQSVDLSIVAPAPFTECEHPVSGKIKLCIKDLGISGGSRVSLYCSLVVGPCKTIIAAMVQINTFYNPSPDSLLVCRFFGQALGLIDSVPPQADSCMGGSGTIPNQHDYDQLAVVYPVH